ncbi:MAG: hypothetical protein GF308_22370 [Candidatus Heimdallarchaeota archaeon]|nr:hypothetical protein [Candidatus Heimdallarchaeota archaeon]
MSDDGELVLGMVVILAIVSIIGLIVASFVINYLFPIVGGIILLGFILLTWISIEEEWNQIFFIVTGTLLLGAGIVLFVFTNTIVEHLPANFQFWIVKARWVDFQRLNTISFYSIGGLFGLFGLGNIIIGIVKVVQIRREYYGPSSSSSSRISFGDTTYPESSRSASSSIILTRSSITTSHSVTTGTDLTKDSQLSDIIPLKESTSPDMIKTPTGEIPRGGDPEGYREAMEQFRQERGLDAPKKLEKKGPFEEE